MVSHQILDLSIQVRSLAPQYVLEQGIERSADFHLCHGSCVMCYEVERSRSLLSP